MKRPDSHFLMVIAAGAALGFLGVMLSVWGNPPNSGICISCFLENAAGALGLHGNPRLQYLRPELPGFLLGGFLAAVSAGEFRSRGGSVPLLRLLAGSFLIVGCAVFIGCPIKLGLRLAAGDLSTLAGGAGLAAGVWIGLQGLRAGVDLGEAPRQPLGAGAIIPVAAVAGVIASFSRPSFLAFSSQGSGAEHAPVVVSLAAGLGIGFLAQRSRFCITGYLRDAFLMGLRAPFFPATAAFLVAAFGTAVATGTFRAGFTGQPGAHADFAWSFLAMVLVGAVAVLIGGCPFRQIIRAGEGDGDAGIAVSGMLLGGAIVHSWGLGATAAGVGRAGQAAVISGLIFVFLIMLVFRKRS